MFRKLLLLALFLILLLGNSHAGENDCRNGLFPLKIRGKTICVELARTRAEQAKGLMNRDSLNKNEGMLFIFEKEKKCFFWMKDTRIPLSIAYIDKSMIIQDILSMTPYSLESVPSSGKVMYALEMNQGFFEKNKISVGDKIELLF